MVSRSPSHASLTLLVLCCGLLAGAAWAGENALTPGRHSGSGHGQRSAAATTTAPPSGHHSSHHSGYRSLGGPQVSSSTILTNAAKLAAISSKVYPPKGSSIVIGSYSDCARPHLPRSAFQTTVADLVSKELSVPASAVTFFDLNAPAAEQFCHATVVYVGASAVKSSGLIVPNPSAPAVVVAFRGSSNIAAAIADVNFESTQKSFRGSKVEVHRGFWESLFGAPAAGSCDTKASGQKPASCSEAIVEHLTGLVKTHSVKGPLQVLVTGHSLGAAEAALFALHLDALGGFSVSAYTYGQPKIGRGKEWRAIYDGKNGLSARTFRVVHGADPVPMLASRCQTRKTMGADYEQVGQLVRVRASPCPTTATGPAGSCVPSVKASDPVCTIEGESAYDDCSIFVGDGKGTGRLDMCFCHAIPKDVVLKRLWGDHDSELYASRLDACKGLSSSTPGALPPQNVCNKAYSLDDTCNF